MSRHLLLTGIAVFAVQLMCSQQQFVKFRDLVFHNVVVRKDISYNNKGIPAELDKKFYLADIYEPAGDTTTVRPLIIWLHGGAFKFGSKNAAGTKLWSETFAKRGYVCAAINYRLDKRRPLFQRKSFFKGCFEAVQDVAEAVSFFKRHANEYRIDTNQIILAGNSAGAIIAIQYAYGDRDELRRMANRKDKRLHIAAESMTNIRAVINFWGAIFRKHWLTSIETPIVSVHGRRDKLVPYANKKKHMHGSYVIHKKADSLQIPNRLKIYEKHAHELYKHFIPIAAASESTKQRWLEAGQFAANFLYDELFPKGASEQPYSLQKGNNKPPVITSSEIEVSFY